MGKKITLAEAIKSKLGQPDAFPLNEPLYNQRADSISIYFSSDEMYSEIVDDILTVFRSFDNDEIIGCELSNISSLAENVQSIIHVNDSEVQLRLLLLSALGTKAAKKYYYDVSDRVGEIKVKVKLAPVAN